jgi:PRC-barrel domain
MTDYTAGAGASGTGGASTDETTALIASNKVEGTAVYNRAGEHLGKVYNFMVNKRSGQTLGSGRVCRDELRRVSRDRR